MADQFQNKSTSNSHNQNDELDFKDLISFLLRNKTLISAFVIFSFLLSVIFSLFKPKTWEGGFDIVLDSDNKSLPNITDNFNLLMLLPNAENDSLKTQVAILESKSVLMPIFNYVQQEKSKTQPQNILDFNSWKKDSLIISLKDETSILKISYRDKDKNLIMPVLKEISKEYQKYSGKAKRRNSSLAKDYLNQQIDLYKKKSFESLKVAQEFAIDQNLQILDIETMNSRGNIPASREYNFSNENRINNSLISNAGIETSRVNAANRIKNIDIMLEKLKNSSKKDVNLLSLTPMYLGEESLFKEVNDLDYEILDLKTKYKDSDPYLKRLTKKRNALFELIKKRSIGYLRDERLRQEAILEASKRPKGVILKYKELIRLAVRDESTLINLENQLRIVNLEEARVEDPWELISDPSLKEKHIFPRKSTYGLIGIIIGSFFGTLLAFLKDKKSDFVFEQYKLEKILKIEIIDNFDPTNKKLLNYSKEIFVNEILKSSKNNFFKLINLGDISKIESENLIEFISNTKINLSSEDYFDNQDSVTPYFVLAKMGTFTYKELKVFKSRIENSENKIIGIIAI